MSASQERVSEACAFRRPDRIPRFDKFWEFPESWRKRLGSPANLTDIEIWIPDETTFPTRARRLKEEGEYVYEVDSWGRTLRRRDGAYFSEVLKVPLPPGTDPDSVPFDPPDMESRFLKEGDVAETPEALKRAKEQHCVFAKTGGPYLRSSFVRGEKRFLMDIASDEGLAKSIADKVCDHLTAVGVEAIRRWSLQETGIWIYDDMAYNDGPMFHPAAFQKIFLPAYRRMIAAYKKAGARYVFLHSDGDIRPLLDMLIDAGVDGIHPLERRANMNVVKLREHYPKLILAGGMDNTQTLIRGPIEKIQAEAREIIDLGRQGGMIIGTHSLSPEIPLKHFVAYHETCVSYGDFSTKRDYT